MFLVSLSFDRNKHNVHRLNRRNSGEDMAKKARSLCEATICSLAYSIRLLSGYEELSVTFFLKKKSMYFRATAFGLVHCAFELYGG